MDTIVSGFRLIIHPNPTSFLILPRPRVANRGEALASRLATITRLITEYNMIAKRTSRADLAAHGCHERIDLLRSYSPQILGLATIPLPYTSYREPVSKAELRQEAKKNGMSASMRWDRFPPTSLEERRQMALEIRPFNRSPITAAVTKASPKLDAFRDYLRTQAKRAAKATSSHPSSYLTNSDWCAEQKRAFDSLMEIDLGLDI